MIYGVSILQKHLSVSMEAWHIIKNQGRTTAPKKKILLGDKNSDFSSLQLPEKLLKPHSEIIISLFKAVINLGMYLCFHWDSQITTFEDY